MTEHTSYQPQLIEETEALMGTPYFPEGTLYESLLTANDELGFKKFIYRSCCRVLAHARSEDREIAAQSRGEAHSLNSRWELTTRKIAEIAFRYEKDLSFLSRQLALVNHATDYIEENWEALQHRLYADQQTYLLDMVDALQKQPRSVQYLDDLDESQRTEVLGVTAVAPTGFGKTRLIEASARLMAAGKPLLDSQFGGRPTRIVLVSPSRALQRQTVKNLREALPDVTIGVMHGDKKEADADIVVVTIEMFNSYFEDGHIAGEPVDVVFIDEVHHLSEPEFRKTFLEQWHGITLGFTATPAYDLERDVRNIIPHFVERSDIMTLIEKGRLNDGQIFTFLIDKIAYDMLLERYGIEPTEAQTRAIIREVIDTLVIEFLTPLLEEGRRGIIFCEQGAQAFYARRLAERLRGVELTNGLCVTADTMDSYADNQDAVMDEFNKGNLQVVTTVDTGREGLDAEFDFVFINCNVVSRLKGHQIVGRGTRPSKRFPITVYAQFTSYLLAGGRQYEKLYSIEEAFGNTDTIEQGRTLRGRGLRGSQSAPPGLVDISEFPEIVDAILARIDRTAIGETFAGVNRGAWAISDDMIPLSDMLEGYEVAELLARKLLRRAGFAWRGRYEQTDKGLRLAYYYKPEAQAYLDEVLPKTGMRSKQEVAEYFGVAITLIEYVTAQHKIKGSVVVRGRGRPPVCYNIQEQEQIGAALKKIPGTQPGDGSLGEVAKELGIDENSVLKMLGLTDVKRYLINRSYPLTAGEIASVRAEFFGTPEAEEGEMYLTLLAETAGIDWQVVDRNMTSAERALAKPKRYKDKRGFVRRGLIWPADTSRDIVERMKKFRSKKLPAHLLPSNNLRRLIRNYGVTPSSKIKSILAEGGFEPEELIIEGTRSMSYCLSWAAIAYLTSTMGKTRGKRGIDIDFSRLPAGPDDRDPIKIAYAQEIQLHFMQAEQLQKYED